MNCETRGRYHNFSARATVIRETLTDIYANNEKADLTPADKRKLRAIVSMLEEAQ